MEQLGEIQIPEIEEKKRRGRKWKIAAGILAALLVVLTAAGVIFAKWYFTEERALLRALRNLSEEIQERQVLWEAAVGNGTADGLDRIKLTTVCNLSGGELPFTLGIDTMLRRDAGARKMEASTEFSVMNHKLVKWNLYGEDKLLSMAFPGFLEQNFVFDAERIDLQYNASLLAEKFGALEDCAFSIDLFPARKPFPWPQYLEDWQEEIHIEKLEDPTDVEIPEKDDRQYRCSQYRLTIAGDWVNHGIEEWLETFSAGTGGRKGIADSWKLGEGRAEIARDIVVLIAVEEKNDRIVRISLEEPFILSVEKEEQNIEMETIGSVCFLGEGRHIDDIVVSAETAFPLAALGLDERLLAVFGGGDGAEDKIEMRLCAELLYNENDTSVTAGLQGLTVSVDRFGTCKLTGEAVLEPLREEIGPPAGENIRLFEITEEEYQSLVRQVMQKVGRWLKAYSIFR
ncbi:MAG: hypothetical protein NC312_02095 [Bacteroides fragilis]|nr:hypothetical protein [Bacteroides fragilis]